MTEQSARVLSNMLTAFDFYAENPGSTIRDLADEHMLNPHTARSWTNSLQSRGCLTRASGLSKGHQHPDTFTVVEGMRPTGVAKRLPRPMADDSRSGTKEIRRVFTKEWTPEFRRDPLVSAFFGPARAEVQA